LRAVRLAGAFFPPSVGGVSSSALAETVGLVALWHPAFSREKVGKERIRGGHKGALLTKWKGCKKHDKIEINKCWSEAGGWNAAEANSKK